MKLALPPTAVLGIRVGAFLLTLVFGVRINEYSLGFLALTLSSLYLIEKKRPAGVINTKIKIEDEKLENPFRKAKRALDLGDLPANVIEKAKTDLFNHVRFECQNSESLDAFEAIKNQSNCVFARKSHLWGAKRWNERLSVDENVQQFLPSFILFCNFCAHLKLDGFLVQLPGELYGRDLKVFAQVFCKILTILSQSDPSERNCMNSPIDRPGWVFEFARTTFFITTFSPLYPTNHSRYSFGVDECFVLFQPEVSFANHNLPDDTPNTNWDEPKTVRDRIRVSFRDSDRSYLIRETTRYPMAHDMIKALSSDDELVKWWTFRDGT